MKYLLFTLFLFFFINGFTQNVRINEFSQGTSGSKEWVELVVSSTSTINNTNCVLAKVSIAGWILDDNNGDFSPINHFTGSGVAPGHMKFRNVQPWNNLPIGAIIVIYNSADRDISIPPDDPFDWVNNDCVYIIPSNHPSIEYCTTSPSVSNCTTRADYGACSYVSTGNWSNVSLANAGDAIQIRDQSFNLVHGLVYGRSTSATGCTTTPDMIGNSLSPLISNLPMSMSAASFIGTSDADYFDPLKWTILAANLATPGSPNNINNQDYITNNLRGGCTCARILPLGEEQKTTQLIEEETLTYKQLGEYIVFNSKKPTNLTLRLFSSDGRYIWGVQNKFKGNTSYRLPKGFFYMNIISEIQNQQEILTIKISNF